MEHHPLPLAVRQPQLRLTDPFTGQTAGLIHNIRPAAEIITTVLAEAQTALGRVRIG